MDLVNILKVSWDWCSQPGVKGVFHLVKSVVEIIRYLIPIILIVLTTIDIINKVINPDEKEGQKKIMNRLIAAVIVFFIPLFIKFVFQVVDWGQGQDGSYNNAESGLRKCWE